MATAAAQSNGVTAAPTLSGETSGGNENGGGIDRHTVIRQPNTR